MKRQFAVAVCALSLGLSVNSPVYAADVNNLLASVSNISDVDARQSSIEKRLQDGLSAGRLTQAQFESFKQALARVADQEAVFRASDGSLSLWETLRLQFDLDRIIKEIEGSLSDRQSGFVDVYGRRDEIAKRLSEAYTQGRLTAQEYAQVHMELDAINKSLAARTTGGAQLSTADSISYVLQLDRLSQRLTRTVHDRQVSLTAIDVRESEIDKKIKDGIASGRITDSEARDLNAEYKRIIDTEEALRRLGRPLTAEEQLTLALDLEKLNGQVDSSLYDADVQSAAATDTAKRRQEVDHNLAGALNSGLLTLLEAQVYKDELDGIARKEDTFRAASGGQMTIVQAQNVLIDLEKLNGKIDRAIFNKKPIWTGIDASIDDLSKRLADAKSSGRLETADEVSLSADLDRIKGNKVRFYSSSSGLDTAEALTLATDLTKLNGRMFKLIKDREIAVIPDLTKRKDEINKRISEGTTTGKLTTDETRGLLEDFDRISAREAAFRATDGLIDEREKLSLALDLERLASNVEKQIRDNPFVSKSISERKVTVEQALSTGTLSGKLSAQEVQNLRDEYNRIVSFERTSVASGNTLDAREALTVASDLDHLAKDIDSQMKNSETALPDLAKREAELYQRITEGVMQGRLTAKDADSLKRDFYRLMDMEAKYRQSGGLSFGEHAALALELEKLSSNIESSMHETQAALPDVDARQGEIDNRLADAVASGKMTSEQSREFTKELDRIARDEVTYRFSGTGLSYAESLALITDLEKLSSKLDTRLAGTTAQWDGIDGRIADSTRRISDALTGQKLSIDVGTQLKNELDRIGQAKNAFQSSGGGLTLAETESLVRDLDRLTRDLDSRVGTGRALTWTDIDARQTRIEARIKTDLASGKLDSQKANKARRDLQVINVTKNAYKRKGGGLSYTELVSLAQSLDKVAKFIGVQPRFQ